MRRKNALEEAGRGLESLLWRSILSRDQSKDERHFYVPADAGRRSPLALKSCEEKKTQKGALVENAVWMVARHQRGSWISVEFQLALSRYRQASARIAASVTFLSDLDGGHGCARYACS